MKKRNKFHQDVAGERQRMASEKNRNFEPDGKILAHAQAILFWMVAHPEVSHILLEVSGRDSGHLRIPISGV